MFDRILDTSLALLEFPRKITNAPFLVRLREEI